MTADSATDGESVRIIDTCVRNASPGCRTTDVPTLTTPRSVTDGRRLVVNKIRRLCLGWCGLVCLLTLTWTTSVSAATKHTVRRAETLSGIAKRYGVSVAQLRTWNRLSGDAIQIGQQLTVDVTQYTVKSGDTLSEIALRFGLTVDKLRRYNGLDSDVLIIGQKLRLKATVTRNRPPTDSYKVRRGDTLSEIAVHHGLPLSELRELNDLSDDRIQIGQVLQVRAAQRPAEAPQTYTVKRGDNLSAIGARFDVGLRMLRQLNGLTGDHISPGQKLRLRPSATEEGIHVVLAGQTLSQIALLHDVELSQLRQINGLDGDLIRIGQKLRLRSTPTTVHVVERGDALWEIARAYGMTVARVRELNDLSGSRIYPGQELALEASAERRFADYTVRRGDNLSEIAQLHQMSVDEVRRLNSIDGSIIHPGQKLRVRPLNAQRHWVEQSEIPWDQLLVHPASVGRIEAANGPYFSKRPKADSQTGRQYFELHPRSPLAALKQARQLWKGFDTAIDKVGRLSDALSGWHVVLDPGHGGVDPGAIVPTVDGNGQRLFIVEDEYVYDVAVRAYVLFRLHGANVDITILSPNHLFRQTAPPTQTFVHEQNEIFNHYGHNRSNRPSAWPMGNPDDLKMRVQIAREAFQGADASRTIFLSLHADITPNAPAAPLVLYYEGRRGRNRDNASRRFAQAMLPALGADAHTRGQSLGVLRNNPAGVKALVEVGNLFHVEDAWALRYEQLRHRNAEKVVRGVLDYAGGRRLARR